jgi:hypothetical protein
LICIILQGLAVPLFVDGNPWPNRLIAIVRECLTLLFIFSIYPAYIKPTKENPG